MIRPLWMVLCLVAPPPAPWAAAEDRYVDPDKAFSLAIGGDWEISRHKPDNSYWATALTTPSETAILNIHAYPLGEYAEQINDPEIPEGADPVEFKKTLIIELSKPHMDVWVEGAQEQFVKVRPTKIEAIEFQGRLAARSGIRYENREGQARTGYALFLLGRAHGFFITMTSRDEQGTDQVDDALTTLVIEPQ